MGGSALARRATVPVLRDQRNKGYPLRLTRSQARRELRARADAELRVHAREVGLEGVHADEERVRDLLVRAPRRRQFGDAPLGGAELARRPRAARADARELSARVLRPARRAERNELVHRPLERAPRRTPAARPAVHATERQQRASALEAQPQRVGRVRVGLQAERGAAPLHPGAGPRVILALAQLAQALADGGRRIALVR